MDGPGLGRLMLVRAVCGGDLGASRAKSYGISSLDSTAATAENHLRFGHEGAGGAPAYQELADAVAEDPFPRVRRESGFRRGHLSAATRSRGSLPDRSRLGGSPFGVAGRPHAPPS
jgi:hypothetical protein